MLFEGARVMTKYIESVNKTTTMMSKSIESFEQKVKPLPITRELLSVFYVVGIIGSFLALLHLYKKRSCKNGKQIFMLKWVVNVIKGCS